MSLPETSSSFSPLPSIQGTDTPPLGRPEIEMFAYVSEFLALKSEVKEQNRIQAKLGEQLQKVLSEMDQLKTQQENEQVLIRQEVENHLEGQIQSFLMGLLNALDGLDFAIAYVEQVDQELSAQKIPFLGKSSFYKERERTKSHQSGLYATRDRFHKWLKSHEVQIVEALGKEFDPLLMMALDRKVDPTIPPQTVIEITRQGYLRKGVLLRPAEVVVSVQSL